MIIATCRDYEDGESFPYLELNDNETVHYFPCDEDSFQSFQPEYWDDEEFNVIIILRERPVRVRGMHFDFKVY